MSLRVCEPYMTLLLQHLKNSATAFGAFVGHFPTLGALYNMQWNISFHISRPCQASKIPKPRPGDSTPRSQEPFGKFTE